MDFTDSDHWHGPSWRGRFSGQADAAAVAIRALNGVYRPRSSTPLGPTESRGIPSRESVTVTRPDLVQELELLKEGSLNFSDFWVFS